VTVVVFGAGGDADGGDAGGWGERIGGPGRGVAVGVGGTSVAGRGGTGSGIGADGRGCIAMSSAR
jgi:hypothetical protein